MAHNLRRAARRILQNMSLAYSRADLLSADVALSRLPELG